jgi:signal transduction histidine kinase/CheY-like chemotaxis protein
MCVSGPKGRYVFVNEAFARMIRKPFEEVRNCDPFQVFVGCAHPDDFDHERATIGRVARGEIDEYRLLKRLVLEDGVHYYQLDAYATRDAQGRLECITGYFTDLSTERALEAAQERFDQELREAQKLGVIGKLAGGIAHDFNNRLVIIMGYGELLKRGLQANGTLAGHADMVLSSAKRAAELTQQLLAYSRRQVLNPVSFDLNDLIGRMKSLVGTLLGEGIELSTRARAERPVLADPGQVEQVLLNLALNARDAMPDGGKIIVETRDVTIGSDGPSTLSPGDYVVLEMTDTGCGIPEDALPHIFEPFFTTKEKGYGTGLGLSMVEGIVRQSGGDVRVRTAAGTGTTFTILLPRARGSEPQARIVLESAPPKEGGLETVLVCDDDEDVRALLVSVLSLRAYTVLSATSGAQALDVTRRHGAPVDLLVTDVAMPEMGGMELAAALRKTNPALSVLYISGYTDNADLLSAPLGPNTHYLAKPFLPGDLTRLVSSILERPG